MIISQTPLRMSFVGGGSDIASFYREHGGAVLSTTIDKYVYVTVSKKFDHTLRVSYSQTEEVESAADLQHPLVREVLRLLVLGGGVEITSVADIPSRGTGLGSSSSFTIALLHALHALQGRYVSSKLLAEQCCEIEIERCGEPIGKQDQYAAAFGGLNFIQFNPDDSVTVEPVICPGETVRRLETELIVFYTGITRSASDLLAHQTRVIGNGGGKEKVMKEMVKLAFTMREEFQRNTIDSFGEILHENWLLKKSISERISNPRIDSWYDLARGAGANGGKLLGAGSGGFMVFHAPVERHDAIRQSLSDLREVKFGFDPQGSRIIFVR